MLMLLVRVIWFIARCSGPANLDGKGTSRWPFLFKHLSYSPVNPFDSFHRWRESTDPTFSNSLDYFTNRESRSRYFADRQYLAGD